jgi:putative acetyltransferase
MSTAHIARAQPDSLDARELIDELESHLAALYPSESRHGYSVDKLVREGVAFFVIYHDDAPAGCGGIQLLGTDYGELKRMYVRPQFRGLGLGKAMVEHLCAHAREHGVKVIRLETGIHQREAIGLYERMGFTRIEPFGDYREDPLSCFYEMRIAPGQSTMLRATL